MFREMRRIKQQLSEEQSADILKRGSTAVLGVLGDDGYPYTVPVNYIYTDGKIYIHCAKSGHKTDAIRVCGKVSLCVVDKDEVVPETLSTSYGSVIVFGRARLIEDEAELVRAVESFGLKYSSDIDYIRSEIRDSLGRLACIEITVEHMTGKRSLKGYN